MEDRPSFLLLANGVPQVGVARVWPWTYTLAGCSLICPGTATAAAFVEMVSVSPGMGLNPVLAVEVLGRSLRWIPPGSGLAGGSCQRVPGC